MKIKNTLLQSSSYIIGTYLIDCGDSDKIVRAIEESGIKLKGILFTHCHQDHIYGLLYVMAIYPQAKIYCSQATYEVLKNGKFNLKYIITEYVFTFADDENVSFIEEGEHQLD